MLDQLSSLLDTANDAVNEVEILLTEMCVERYAVHQHFKKNIVDVLDQLSVMVEVAETCKILFSEMVEGKNRHG